MCFVCIFRVDTSLVDFNNMHWVRGDISFLFNGGLEPGKGLVVLDNKKKVFQRVTRKVS